MAMRGKAEWESHVDSELLREAFASVRFERAACHSPDNHSYSAFAPNTQDDASHGKAKHGVGRLTSVGDADEGIFLVERVVTGEDFHDGLGLRQDMLSLYEHAVLYEGESVSQRVREKREEKDSSMAENGVLTHDIEAK